MTLRVARSESHFLLFVRNVLRGGPQDQLFTHLAGKNPLYPRIGPTAMGILQRSLARGCVLALARHGGWRRETRPVGDPEHAVDGRLWDRHPDVHLTFRSWSYQILVWSWTRPQTDAAPFPRPPTRPGLGDRLVAFLVARALIEARLPQGLAAVAHEPLAQLYAAGRAPLVDVDWPAWLDTGGDILLEGLGESLGRSWAEAERWKLGHTEPLALAEVGEAQQALLRGLLQALEHRDRLDLADFLLHAGQLVVADPAAPPVLEPVDLRASSSLRDRMRARAACAAFTDAVTFLADAMHGPRSTRFFDDTYDAAQARLRRWERFGDDRARVFRDASARLADI
ncbi:MAG: hypothetical protein H6734_17160 [Alphaproteobacteria bacterium]|nr:hypothetical protein [Alphaproteobacteria bacterium]